MKVKILHDCQFYVLPNVKSFKKGEFLDDKEYSERVLEDMVKCKHASIVHPYINENAPIKEDEPVLENKMMTKEFEPNILPANFSDKVALKDYMLTKHNIRLDGRKPLEQMKKEAQLMLDDKEANNVITE
jgi:hypothetical protein